MRMPLICVYGNVFKSVKRHTGVTSHTIHNLCHPFFFFLSFFFFVVFFFLCVCVYVSLVYNGYVRCRSGNEKKKKEIDEKGKKKKRFEDDTYTHTHTHTSFPCSNNAKDKKRTITYSATDAEVRGEKQEVTQSVIRIKNGTAQKEKRGTEALHRIKKKK